MVNDRVVSVRLPSEVHARILKLVEVLHTQAPLVDPPTPSTVTRGLILRGLEATEQTLIIPEDQDHE